MAHAAVSQKQAMTRDGMRAVLIQAGVNAAEGIEAGRDVTGYDVTGYGRGGNNHINNNHRHNHVSIHRAPSAPSQGINQKPEPIDLNGMLGESNKLATNGSLNGNQLDVADLRGGGSVVPLGSPVMSAQRIEDRILRASKNESARKPTEGETSRESDSEDQKANNEKEAKSDRKEGIGKDQSRKKRNTSRVKHSFVKERDLEAQVHTLKNEHYHLELMNKSLKLLLQMHRGGGGMGLMNGMAADMVPQVSSLDHDPNSTMGKKRKHI